MLTDALIIGRQTTHGVNVSGILTQYVSPFCKNKEKNLIAGYFFHDLTFRFAAVTLKHFQNYPCFRIFFFDLTQFNRTLVSTKMCRLHSLITSLYLTRTCTM